MEYSIHLSRAPGNWQKRRVPAVQAMLVGHYENGNAYKPDREAVRAALPAMYRKAFDRDGAFWYDNDDNTKAAYSTLHDARGRYLNTIYAIPVWSETNDAA